MPQTYHNHGYKMSTELKQSLFLEERQLIVADMYYRKKLTQKTIAGELGVSEATIGKDIKKIRKEYHMKRMEKIQVYFNIMDQQFNAVEREAWTAWERSIGKTRKKVTKTTGGGEGGSWEETITETDLVGDPRFLTVILSTQDRRIRIFGLDQPKEIIVNTMEGRLTKLILEGKVTFDMLSNDVGRTQAIRYFNLAGVAVPDIVEGEIVDTDDDVVIIQDRPDDLLEVLEIPEQT